MCLSQNLCYTNLLDQPMLKSKHKKHLHKKVILNLKIFMVISVVLSAIVVYEIFTNRVSPLLAALGLMLGISVGIFTARMYLFSWDKDARQVISRLDLLGIGILILYILASIFRTRIIGFFVQPSYVTGMSVSVVTGLMIGRILGTGQKITKILKEQNLH